MNCAIPLTSVKIQRIKNPSDSTLSNFEPFQRHLTFSLNTPLVESVSDRRLKLWQELRHYCTLNFDIKRLHDTNVRQMHSAQWESPQILDLRDKNPLYDTGHTLAVEFKLLLLDGTLWIVDQRPIVTTIILHRSACSVLNVICVGANVGANTSAGANACANADASASASAPCSIIHHHPHRHQHHHPSSSIIIHHNQCQ